MAYEPHDTYQAQYPRAGYSDVPIFHAYPLSYSIGYLANWYFENDTYYYSV